MATKKKVTAKKKTAAPKKKVAPKKKSSKTQAPVSQEILQSKSTYNEESYTQEEDNQPSMPPVYTSSNQASKDNNEAEPNNSMLKYLVLAALILVGVIAYSTLSKKGSSNPEKLETVEESSSQKAPEPAQEQTAEKLPFEPASSETATKGNPSTSGTDTPAPADKPSSLKGYAVAQMVEGKTFSEAVDHCKSIGMRLPKAEETKKIPSASVPSDLKKAEIWIGDIVSGKNLRYVFATNKNMYTDSKTKLKVLCKE